MVSKHCERHNEMVTVDDDGDYDDGDDDDQQGNTEGKVMQRLLQDALRHDDADDDGHY